MQEELKELEQESRRRLVQLDDAVLRKRTELLEATRANTRLLTEASDLQHDKKVLERSLNDALRAPEDTTRDWRREEQEQKQLVQLVRMQAAEIESLRQEIMRLMRKDGHIVPPAPKPVDRLPPVRST